MNDVAECPVCGYAARTMPLTSPSVTIDCSACGPFDITTTALARLPHKRELLPSLSGWIYDQNQVGAHPAVDSDTLQLVARLPAPRMAEKPDRLLHALIQYSGRPGDVIAIDDQRLLAPIYGNSLDEVRWLTTLLVKRGLIDEVKKEAKYLGEREQVFVRVTPEGYIRQEELRDVNVGSSQGFVAMWFDPKMDGTYLRALVPAIVDSGYRPFRVDRTEHIGKIDDEIIAQIRRSRFIVADFTGHRGGVYFEAGYALGLRIPVIWCCRKDHVHALHFDIRQFNCIDWDTEADLRMRLQRRIEAVLGDGPLKTS